MSNTPNYDAKIKTMLDNLQPGERTYELTGEKWMMDEEEIGWYKTFNVPPHPWAPIVRLKHLMGFPSGIAIWKKAHADTGKEILTFVHPDSPFKVIEDKEWWSREFAQDEKELDSSRPFFDQFRELAYSIPVSALRDDGSNINCVAVDSLDDRDSHLVFGTNKLNRVTYAAISFNQERSILTTNSISANESYMINACAELHNCRYCFQNGKLVNCTFSFACSNLENCFGSVAREHEQYLFFNEQLTKSEWEKRVAGIDLKSRKVFDEYSEKFLKLVTETYWPPDFRVEPLEDSYGEYLLRAKGNHDCYWNDTGTDIYKCWVGLEVRDSAYTMWAGWTDRTYHSVDVVKASNTKFCFRVWNSQSMEYSMDCHDCEFCFGCVGLRKKKFHIFNKSYSEEEYWKKLDEIKSTMLERGEYGTFFPADLSQSGYQFSMGQFFLGYTEKELAQFKAPTFDPAIGNVVASGDIVKSSDLPDHLDDVDPKIHIGKPILDEKLGRMYTITQSEYEFYKEKGVPIPNEHFLTRMNKMFNHSNGPIPEKATCEKCGVEITTYKNKMFSGKRKFLCREHYLEFRGSW
ncbi:MAG: hypothetical protein O2877_01130 [bacterium]|nr:hypothetical protein [bacterium]